MDYSLALSKPHTEHPPLNWAHQGAWRLAFCLLTSSLVPFVKGEKRKRMVPSGRIKTKPFFLTKQCFTLTELQLMTQTISNINTLLLQLLQCSYHVQSFRLLFVPGHQSGCICRAEGSDQQEYLQTEQEQHGFIHGEVKSLMKLRNIQGFLSSLAAP